MLSRSMFAATAVLALAAAPSLAATLTAGSSASTASASFVVNGKSGTLAPVAAAMGTAPPDYNKTVKLPSLSKSQTFDVLTVKATVNNIQDSASSSTTSGSISSNGSVSTGSLSGLITTPLGTALTLSATKMTSSAGLTKTATQNSPVGAAAMTGLSIVSSVFGINAHYSGSPAPNHILYQSSDKKVTVYLNREIKKTSGGKVTSIRVSAVNLHVSNLTYAGQTVSGDFDLAVSEAH